MKTLLSLIFLAPYAFAGGGQIPDYKEVHSIYLGTKCFDSKDQAELNSCSEKSLNESKVEMKQLEIKLISSYGHNDKKSDLLIENAQESWFKSSSLDCELETYYSKGGSGYDAIFNLCLKSKVNERISYLKLLIDNP